MTTLADELAQHHHINRFFPIESTSSNPAADVVEAISPTFEEVGEDVAGLELQDRGGVEGGGGRDNHTHTDVKRATPSTILSKVNASVTERQATEFQSEMLLNPFFVPKKKG